MVSIAKKRNAFNNFSKSKSVSKFFSGQQYLFWTKSNFPVDLIKPDPNMNIQENIWIPQKNLRINHVKVLDKNGK